MKGSSRSGTLSYVCGQCGHHSPKWMGFCPQCRSSEALVEAVRSHAGRSQAVDVVSATAGHSATDDRSAVGIREVDRVLGGGIVPGAAILVGGEPGIGKSTLLLQVADSIAGRDGAVLFTTAEESVHQVQMRARRIAISSAGVEIAAVYDVDEIIATASARRPGALIVDSIQAVSSTDISGSSGGVSQVRASAARLIAFAKSSGIPVILVGHVTKDGSIAGPRTLEHMVDVVLYLEGDSEHGLRFLRGIKNRYGSVNEVGVFTMTQEGLAEVPDPSGLLVSHRDVEAAGSVLFPTVEGKRPMIVEVQALVVRSEAPQPRRAVTGLPAARVHQLLGVLERHMSMALRDFEVYVSIMGGLRVTEPAVDLPVALAVASAYTNTPLGGAAAWGEVGLTGELRPVARPVARLAEVERMHGGPAVSFESHRRLCDVLATVGITSCEPLSSKAARSG